MIVEAIQQDLEANELVTRWMAVAEIIDLETGVKSIYVDYPDDLAAWEFEGLAREALRIVNEEDDDEGAS